jgi:membrane protein DedA with SNARE-associated domain
MDATESILALITLSDVEALLEQSSHATSYVLVALLLLSSGFGAPVPEDVPLLFGGWLCKLEQANLSIMIVIGWCFVLAGDCILYFLGRRYGHHVPRIPGLRAVLTEHRIVRAERFMQEHGGKTLFVIRFVAVVRATMWFTAGALKVPFWKFIAYDGAAAAIFAPGLILLGWYFGPKSEYIRQIMRWTKVSLTILVILAIGAGILWYFRQRRLGGLDADAVDASGKTGNASV